MKTASKKYITFVLVFFLLYSGSFAATEGNPSILDLPKHVIDDTQTFVETAFRSENIPALGAIAASTLLLVHYDQDLRNGAKKLGKKIGLNSVDKTKTYIRAGRIQIFNGPDDTGSAMYFLGDGWLHGAICMSFYAYGALSSNDRSIRTAYALGEGIVTTALITQALKHATGRESPSTTSIHGGVWRFFPDPLKYARSEHRYDAYPSGHVATAMMTITVISSNYPDNHYIQPVGYVLISLLAFQMVNNGAHWTSDYPLALGIGYSVGKIAVNNVNGTKTPKKSAEHQNVHFLPYFADDAAGVMAYYRI